MPRNISNSGSKKVLISAPATDPDITVVYGINHMSINDDHNNCLMVHVQLTV